MEALDRLPPAALLLLVPCSWPASFHSSHGFQDEIQTLAILSRPFLLWFLPPFLTSFPAFPSVYLCLSHHKLVKNSLNLSLRFTLLFFSPPLILLIISMPVQPILLCLCSHNTPPVIELCYFILYYINHSHLKAQIVENRLNYLSGVLVSIQQIFMEYLLCTSHYSKHFTRISEQNA